ncbi:MAG: hypothetical protein WC451_04970 [Patescibacteria group bacterium]|jgi:hypothetical protein
MPQHIPYTTGLVYLHIIHNAITENVAVDDAKAQLCAGAKAIALTITEAGSVNNRSGVFVVSVSIDGGATFYTYAMLMSNVANSNAQTPIRVASLTRASAGTDVLFFDPATLGAITHFKVSVTITDTDSPAGTFTVKAAIKY